MEGIVNEQGELEGRIEYLPIQEWFMKNGMKEKNHFNHSFLIHVAEKIDKGRLGQALEKLNQQHDMLRAIFRESQQSYRKTSRPAEIKELDVSGKSEEEIDEELTNWQNKFDIEGGYLWQSGIIRGYKDGSERIYIAIHHLVFDAASWPLIREDLKDLYEGKEMREKGSSYRQWVEGVKECGKRATAEEKQYWENINREQGQQETWWGKLVEDRNGELKGTGMEFNADVTQKLLQASREVYNCEVNDLLVSALGYALYEVSGEERNWITMECPGREAIDQGIDVSRTVGWFTTMYPAELKIGKDVRETIIENREGRRKLPYNGIGYGAIHGYDKLPTILFNYLDYLGGTTENSWQIGFPEKSGQGMSMDNKSGNIIDFNGLRIGGKIRFSIESYLRAEKHKELCEVFKGKVEEIASHC